MRLCREEGISMRYNVSLILFVLDIGVVKWIKQHSITR